ncbi:hypothetical protein GBA52_003902 [Prunus armeniaca]|nr:hypothetical protein GBA52_003902 [Prunus armeniaca]
MSNLVSSLHDGKLHPYLQASVDPNTRVETLIDWDSKSWNLTPIQASITDEEKLAIQLIPIGNGKEEDRLVWPGEKNGRFSVRSGYHCIHALQVETTTRKASTSSRIDPLVWKNIWKAEVSPKIKNFLWRVTHDRLPTAMALQERKIARTPLCPICQAHEESIDHLLLFCPWVELIWFRGPLNYKIDKQGITTFDQWLLKCTTDGLQSKEEKMHISCIIAVTCWIIWKSRNHFVFDQCKPQPLLAIKTILSQVEELAVLNNKRNTAPDAHVIKVNFDAAWLASSGKAGAGLIARSANGEFVGAKCLSFQAESVIMAEAIAGLEGCKWAYELGLSEVCFESDSKELVESVKGNIKRGRWNLYPLLSRIRECNSIFSNCNWAWTGRKNNEAADHLASLALSRSSPEVWVSMPPTSLVHILNRDDLPCPPRAST